MKSISAIHPAITENTENILVKRAPHILIRESHSCNGELVSLHIKLGIAREVPHQSLSRTEAISCLPQILTLCSCEEKNGRLKGYKGSTLMQAL